VADELIAERRAEAKREFGQENNNNQ
jgi:hypothetical protein